MAQSVFTKSLDIEINSCVSHHIIESLAVLALGLIWFFILCTASYMINDLLPPYRKTEKLGFSWMWMIVEISLTLFFFHQIVRILQHVSSAIFANYPQIKTLPEVHGSILGAFSLLIFQTSLSLRAKRVWISFFGKTNVGET